jgi:hypothetical protein
MLRRSIWLLAVLAASCGTAATGTYHGYSVDVTGAPAAPTLVHVEPQLDLVPGTTVSTVANVDYDVFRYDNRWYLANSGYWYSSDRFDGPYVVVSARRVPRAVLTIPSSHWKHDNRLGVGLRD